MSLVCGLRRAAALGSVACVPAPSLTRAFAAPKLARVLAATDFSPIGDSAVPLAYSAVPSSVTQAVVAGTRRPVLLARKPVE